MPSAPMGGTGLPKDHAHMLSQSAITLNLGVIALWFPT
jgi:hypothetical protein